MTTSDDITIDAANVLHAASDARKAAENTARQHINAIWQHLETWPVGKIAALVADLKGHLP